MQISLFPTNCKESRQYTHFTRQKEGKEHCLYVNNVATHINKICIFISKPDKSLILKIFEMFRINFNICFNNIIIFLL